MLIGVPLETRPGRHAWPSPPRRRRSSRRQGHTIRVQAGAGVAASVTDAAYAGRRRRDRRRAPAPSAATSCSRCARPLPTSCALMKPGTALVGMLNPFDADGLSDSPGRRGLTSFALEAAPRTTRAQSMDVLSSQANIAGYKAVMIAADKYQRFFPMLMTAAGTVKAARVVDPRRRRGRAAGHRHRQAAGRGDRGERRAARA